MRREELQFLSCSVKFGKSKGTVLIEQLNPTSKGKEFSGKVSGKFSNGKAFSFEVFV